MMRHALVLHALRFLGILDVIHMHGLLQHLAVGVIGDDHVAVRACNRRAKPQRCRGRRGNSGGRL